MHPRGAFFLLVYFRALKNPLSKRGFCSYFFVVVFAGGFAGAGFAGGFAAVEGFAAGAFG